MVKLMQAIPFQFPI